MKKVIVAIREVSSRVRVRVKVRVSVKSATSEKMDKIRGFGFKFSQGP